jgi:hypothetical protein
MKLRISGLLALKISQTFINDTPIIQMLLFINYFICDERFIPPQSRQDTSLFGINFKELKK